MPRDGDASLPPQSLRSGQPPEPVEAQKTKKRDQSSDAVVPTGRARGPSRLSGVAV